MEIASTLNDLSYHIQDNYDIWVLKSLSKAQKRQAIGFVMFVSYKEIKTTYEQ